MTDVVTEKRPDSFVDIGAEGDFEEGRARVVSVEGREIGVVRWRGEVFALRNVCPHEFGPVCAGFTLPLLHGDQAGTLEVDEDQLVIVCPWHGWEFDARTGRAVWWAESNYRLRSYPAKIESGRILVDVVSPPRKVQPAT